ncbi:MAG: GntR family transcriptional regulator [Saccharofermentans sp.]|nr:GntR family transcriptional regulator [Mageeibacillus sp.]MCI1275380.1 GntR family transcriptional regulator [Saccharofermentans sp.]MCI1769981.1 GntR family transcriptional regulator [Mageeibacillus sp.]MCI2044246.1 GntR family transcriptional regulator [Mageeibacillus sp.]
MIISQSSGEPIYKQISDQFRTDILEGRIQPGDMLPSIRSLAKELRISVITTMKAYEVLQNEGYIVSIQGKGFCVNAQDKEMLREQHIRMIENSLLEAIKSARIAGMSYKELKQTLDYLIKLDEEDSK